MATENQIAANRRNSQLSTGPRTESGKATTRMNALKSGIHAQSHVIRGEDPEALAQLAAEYNAEFHPVTPRQRDLVDTLVRNEWKVRRLEIIETDLWEYKFNSNDARFADPRDPNHIRARKHPHFIAFHELEDRLERLQRRLHAYERSTQRALKQFRDLQAIEAEPPSDEIGFVPPNPVEPLVGQAPKPARDPQVPPAQSLIPNPQPPMPDPPTAAPCSPTPPEAVAS